MHGVATGAKEPNTIYYITRVGIMLIEDGTSVATAVVVTRFTYTISRRPKMKRFASLSLMISALAMALTIPAFAGDANQKAAQKAGQKSEQKAAQKAGQK